MLDNVVVSVVTLEGYAFNSEVEILTAEKECKD